MSNTVCQNPGCLAVRDIPAVIANLESGVHAFWEENGVFFPPKPHFTHKEMDLVWGFTTLQTQNKRKNENK